jgi:hypothetical protein
VDVADYIRRHTTPDDTIAVFGSEPQIYFYAHRLPATGHIYTYALMERSPHAHDFQLQMMHEIEAARPKFIVYVQTNLSWLAWSQSDQSILNWFPEYESKHLQLVGIVQQEPGGRSKIRWDESGIQGYRGSRPLILVYRRKD